MILAISAELHSTGTLAAEIERLSQLDIAVLNEHTNEDGLCAVCGSAFPCESTMLAGHNVALL